MRLALVLLMGVAGCATRPAPTLADFTPDLLCYVRDYSPLEPERVNVAAELVRRGYQCTPEDATKGYRAYLHWQEIQQAQARQDAASRRALGDALIGLGAAAVIASPPPAPPPPSAVRCTTVYTSGRAETLCR